jgi:hypothetical protein
MKRACLIALCGIVVGAIAAHVPMAHAVAPFKKEFDAVYVKKAPTTDAQKSLLASVEKAKCNVCHTGKSKKERNGYGQALAQLLTKKDGKDVAKIHAALEKVAGMKSKPDDAGSPTFGELIEQGKLPGGEAEADTATASAGDE